MIKVADLETKIREMAGEIEIYKIRIGGLEDDLRIANQKIAELTPPAEGDPTPARKGRG